MVTQHRFPVVSSPNRSFFERMEQIPFCFPIYRDLGNKDPTEDVRFRNGAGIIDRDPESDRIRTLGLWRGMGWIQGNIHPPVLVEV